MTSFRVAVFDDDNVEEFINKIQSEDLEFVKISPKGYESDIDELNNESFDAFIIDQKLSDDGHIRYDGTTIIQQLRTWMASNVVSQAPIILWSSDGKILSFKNEHSSHNLVDIVWEKSLFYTIDPQSLISELYTLISGYKELTSFTQQGAKSQDITSIFFEGTGHLGLVPEEALSYLKNENNQKEHTLAQFVINGLLRFDGPLISETTLAARLGVSIDKSPHWNDFKTNALDEITYKGVFCGLNQRFWSVLLDIWWIEHVIVDELVGLSAEERVEALNGKYNLDFHVADIPEEHSESNFWHSCHFSGAPIDPRDGYQLAFPEKRAWQDPLYSCFNSIRLREHKKFGYELISDDLERFKAIYAANKHGSK